MRDNDHIILEGLYKTVNEQSTFVSDVEKMTDKIFWGAYEDWKQRQERKASGIPYETSGQLWIRPTFNGQYLPLEEIQKFRATVEGGTIKNERVYEGQKDPDILPYYAVNVVKMSDKVPLVTIESPNYRSEPIPLKAVDVNIEKIDAPVDRK